MLYTAKDIGAGVALAGLFGLVLFVNDVFMERRIQRILLAHPEIVLNALGQDQERRVAASSSDMKRNLVAKWDDLSKTRIYAVRFNGVRFESRLVRMADIAATPDELNLVATDYRCTYCMRDRHAVDVWLRANPNHDIAFLEAPLLGTESAGLAEDVLRRAQIGGADYYQIHNSEFESSRAAAETTDKRDDVIDSVLAEQKAFSTAIGIFATPTYIRTGVFQSGTIEKFKG